MFKFLNIFLHFEHLYLNASWSVGLTRYSWETIYNSFTLDKYINKCVIFLGVFHNFKSIDEINQKMRERPYTIWHDHSPIGGHSYFLITIGFLYDPLIYVTNKEWKKKR